MAHHTPTYSNAQRLAWLRDHTRRNPDTGNPEMWHILECAWRELRPETLDSLYPVIVRGSVPVEQLWPEILHAAEQAPSYDGEAPSLRRYDDKAFELWVRLHVRRRLHENTRVEERKSIIDGKWYPLQEPRGSFLIPREFRLDRGPFVIVTRITWALTGIPKLAVTPAPHEVLPLFSDSEAFFHLIYGGLGFEAALARHRDAGRLSATLSNGEGKDVRVGGVCDFTDAELRVRLGGEVKAGVALAQIAAVLLGPGAVLRAADRQALVHRLGEIGWIQRRTAAARLWCPPLLDGNGAE